MSTRSSPKSASSPCNFAPTGWAMCDGQLLPISQNTALFSLLGTNYGGDGKSTFALPDLQGSAPMQRARGRALASRSRRDRRRADRHAASDRDAGAQPHLATPRPPAATTATSTTTSWRGARAGGRQERPQRGQHLQHQRAEHGRSMPGRSASTGGSLPHNNMHAVPDAQLLIALQGVFPPRDR